MNRTIDRAKTALFYLVLAITIGILMASCSSTQKNKKSAYHKSDSAAVASSQESGIRLIDSTASKVTEVSTQDEFVLQFADEGDTTEMANDYAASEPKKATPIHQVSIAGKEISSSRNIKSITIKSTGKILQVDLNQVSKKDSGQASKTSEVVVKKVEDVKEKQVDKTGANVWICLGGLVILIVALRFGYIAWPKRKATKNQS